MNKYANQYLDSLKSFLASYRPFESGDSIVKGVPVLGGLGALSGAAIGAIKDPGVDEEGERKSRLGQILAGAATGGALGAGASIAMPFIPSAVGTAGVGVRDAYRRLTNPGAGFLGLRALGRTAAKMSDSSLVNATTSMLPQLSVEDILTALSQARNK